MDSCVNGCSRSDIYCDKRISKQNVGNLILLWSGEIILWCLRVLSFSIIYYSSISNGLWRILNKVIYYWIDWKHYLNPCWCFYCKSLFFWTFRTSKCNNKQWGSDYILRYHFCYNDDLANNLGNNRTLRGDIGCPISDNTWLIDEI